MSALLPFETAVDQHGTTVLRVCRAVLGVHTDAEDAWSETFAAALAEWENLASSENVRGWLVTVAHRKAIDVLRVRTKQGTTLEHAPEPHSRLGLPQTDHLDLYRAIAALPPGQRSAVTLHYLAGLPYADVARESGISPAAARRAGSDGVRTLRAALTVNVSSPTTPTVVTQPGTGTHQADGVSA
ncbi:RNA polymerase sigma factor [Mycetocola tolaasinivorans]|uniref:RNA polymerase sigma factor n=1 Tax=Mycetocola tolaasinivorans TaxID=76635 RepID=A0A3L7AAV4_9MICO|nr:RNA polymerase sigma factor [Mycetocola tolaasinivorans]RLP76791.1 RNA polymerase sigma factor [Mycetocola tolaasinivorans]